MINQAGQTWGGTTGGILLSDNAALSAGNDSLDINGSNGQGIVALNNSHATITGVTVTGSTHGGLLAANLSSIHVAPRAPPKPWSEATQQTCFAVQTR